MHFVHFCSSVAIDIKKSVLKHKVREPNIQNLYITNIKIFKSLADYVKTQIK
jgi:hypothetical protein